MKVEFHNLLLFGKLLSTQCLRKRHDLAMNRSVIIQRIEYPPTAGCFEMKGCAMHLDKGQRASQKQKKKDISLKTEMFIKDNCRLPRLKQTEGQLLV